MILRELQIEKGTKHMQSVKVPGTAIQLPVTVIDGEREGKTIVITAGIHGGEYLGIRCASLLAQLFTPADVCGRIMIVHCCNPQAFYAHRGYVVPEDGKNLNRIFPGSPNGTLAEKTAHFLAEAFVPLADYLVDLHCGDVSERLVPHVYYINNVTDEINAASHRLAMACGAGYAVPSYGTGGIFHYACRNGVPAILVERGASGLWSDGDAYLYAAQIRQLLATVGFVPPKTPFPRPVEISHATYAPAPDSGCWLPAVAPGDQVSCGQKLGEIRDFFGHLLAAVVAEHDGIVLYMASSLSIRQDAPLIAYGALAGDA